jgi:hypothetical protein
MGTIIWLVILQILIYVILIIQLKYDYKLSLLAYNKFVRVYLDANDFILEII